MAETNICLENVKLLAQYNDFHIATLERLQEEEALIEEESALFNYFMERFSAIDTAAKKDNKEEMPVEEELQQKIREFQEIYWPRILKRHEGTIPEHRNPFPDYATGVTVKVSDISEIKGRLAYLANGQDRALSRHARQYQSIINADYHTTNMMTHHNTQNPSRAIVKNQLTR